jgi:hypothetical protein
MFGISIKFGQKAKEVRPDDIQVLFHTEAAYHGEHGRLLVTNRAVGMIEKPIIFCLKGVSTPLPMNLRLFWHIWESAKAEGFIPLEMLSYGNTIEYAEVNGQAPRQAMHLDLAGSSASQAVEAVEGAIAGSRLRSVAGNGFAAAEIPAYLRKQQEQGADPVGHQSAGFVAATTQTK